MKKKIPDNAKCVFKGIIYDVYHWEQEMFDGSFETFERLYRKPSVVVIPMDSEGNVYYSKQEQPAHKSCLWLFGGRSEDGEAPLDVAQRELLEEAGLKSNSWHELADAFDIEMKIDHEVLYYVALNCKKVSEQSLDAGEKIEVFKATLDEFINNVIPNEEFKPRYMKNIISDYSEDKKQEFKGKILSLIEGEK
jgi:ADP-ribose pyrophosphatase